MCSNKVKSVLRSDKVLSKDLQFQWQMVVAELRIHAQTLLAILTESTCIPREKENRSTVIGFCVAILLKYRYSKMSVLQRIISVILYAGHTSKMVILPDEVTFVQLISNIGI